VAQLNCTVTILCLSDAYYVPELTEKSLRRGNHCTRSFTQFYD